MSPAPDPLPDISVVIPTCHRPHALAHMIEQITPEFQRVPAGSFEVIVSDDSRDDETRLLIAQRFPHVRYVAGPRHGPASNRNRGAALAHGEWLVFVDDDCQPVAGWLDAIRRTAAALEPDVIEGRMVTPDKVDSPFVLAVENLAGDQYWSGNLAVRRRVFNDLGGFDEDFEEAGGEDMEFADRIRRSGLRRVFCAEATVLHPAHVVTLRYLAWRVFLDRWHLLYLLKTRRGVPIEGPMWLVLASLLASRTVGLIRTTWRWLSTLRPTNWRSTTFRLCVSWVTFPVMLPYLAYWEVRFRRMLRQRRPAVAQEGRA
jgi:GT2 family glycosyltransferase